MSDSAARLVRHFESIYREHMQGLPIVNPRLRVEAIGFCQFGDHEVGVVITPWFMNLVLLPGGGDYESAEQGAAVELALPGGTHEFNVSHDAELGTFMTAVLFRSMTDFPDQETARAIAEEILQRVLNAPAAGATRAPKISRRELFSRLGAN